MRNAEWIYGTVICAGVDKPFLQTRMSYHEIEKQTYQRSHVSRCFVEKPYAIIARTYAEWRRLTQEAYLDFVTALKMEFYSNSTRCNRH